MYRAPITKKKLVQMMYLYGGFSVLFIFVAELYRLETALFCVVVSFLGILSRLNYDKTENWVYHVVFLSFNPIILIVLGGVRIWTARLQVSPILIVGLFIIYWLIYPFQALFPDLADWIAEEAAQPKSVLGKIIFRYLLILIPVGATAGRSLARSGTEIGVFLLGCLGLLGGYLFQFFAVHSNIQLKRATEKSTSKG